MTSHHGVLKNTAVTDISMLNKQYGFHLHSTTII